MKHVENVGNTNTRKITAGKPEGKEKKLRDYGVNVTILLKLYPAQRLEIQSSGTNLWTS